MKRIVIVLLAICLAAFAFGEGFGMKAFVAGGFSEPGLIGTGALAYNHNTTGHGFDVKLGARKSLGDFFEMPSFLPLTAQVSFGYYHQAAKGFLSSTINAFVLNIDALYNLDEVVEIPIVDVNPFLGIKYDAQFYKSTSESYSAHLLGLQLGAMVCYDLSDLVVDGLGVELVLAETFDFDVTGTFNTRGGNAAVGSAYVNLGVSYAFEF